MAKNSFPTNWNTALLYRSDTDSQIKKDKDALEQAHSKFIKKWKNNSNYLKDPKVLRKALDEYEMLVESFNNGGKEGYYYWLKFHQDQVNPEIKAKYNQTEDYSNKKRNEIQFFELNISKIDPKLQKKFLSAKELEPYKHFLEKNFAWSKHLLSDAEEKILNLKSQTAYSNWIKMTSGFLAKEQREVKLDDGTKKLQNYQELLTLINSHKKNIRDGAAEAFNDILAKFKDVATEEMNSILANKKSDDELRNFNRPEESRLLSDDIEVEIVDQLAKTVAEHFDLSTRFYKLKAKLLGLPKLAYHERNIEYGDLDKEYKYETAVDIVTKVLNNLDPEFAEIFIGFVKNGQIDVYPKKGKWGGAFCVYWSKADPTFVLLNYTDKLVDVITTAHELGHGINNELNKEKQNALNFGTPTSTAEIASTFMEDFVLDEIAKSADEKLQLALLMERLNRVVSSLQRQIACYMFEQELHKEFRAKGYLSGDEIGKIFLKHLSAYMGKYVEQSKGSENWWIYWSHIRTYFYNYAYAQGILVAKAMQSMVRENPKNIEKVKYFLSAGLSDSPKNIFKNIGIDLTKKSFWEKGISEIEQMLAEAEKLAKIVK